MPVPTSRLALAVALLSLIVVAMPLAAPVGLVVANGALLLVAVADWALAPAPGRVARAAEGGRPHLRAGHLLAAQSLLPFLS